MTFLGVNFDETLSWKIHIDKLINTVSKALFVLNKVKRYIPVSALKSLYFALIHSRLSYGTLLWGNSTSLSRLFKIQKRAIRIITNSNYRAHTDPIFKSLQIMKLADIYKFQLMTVAFDYINGALPNSFNSFFPNTQLHSAITRQNTNRNLCLPRPRTNFSKMSVYYMIPSHWNSLHNDIKTETNRSKLKRKFKTIVFDNYTDSVNCCDPFCRQCTGHS